MKKTTVFITHDLDEAVRVGERIAIMRDGKIVQIGTPEEIITAPADDYVTDFVAGISRLKVVRAKSLMQPMAEAEAHYGPLSGDMPKVDEEENLTQIIRLMMRWSAHSRSAGHSTVGVITAQRIPYRNRRHRDVMSLTRQIRRRERATDDRRAQNALSRSRASSNQSDYYRTDFTKSAHVSRFSFNLWAFILGPICPRHCDLELGLRFSFSKHSVGTVDPWRLR